MRPLRIPSLRLWLTLGLVLVLAACSGGDATPTLAPGVTPAPTSEQGLPPPPVVQVQTAEWLVMLYFSADDPSVDARLHYELNEAEVAGSSPNVHVVAQIDRVNGPATRYYLGQHPDTTRIESEVAGVVGEVNTADDRTLSEFIFWATQTYPAQRYALVLGGSGLGWAGALNDLNPPGSGDVDVTISRRLGDYLWLTELEAALASARANASLPRLDLIAFDAPAMAQIEVFAALAPHANYAVAPPGHLPGVGMAYAAVLQRLHANPTQGGDILAQSFVETFVREDLRVTDDAERLAYLAARQGIPLPDPVLDLGAAAFAEILLRPAALTAVDLSLIGNVQNEINQLTRAIGLGLSPATLRQARTQAYAYPSLFDGLTPNPVVDLRSFAEVLKALAGEQVITVEDTANSLIPLIDAAVLAVSHGDSFSDIGGFGIYFPTEPQYAEQVTNDYQRLTSTFALMTTWRSALADFYTATPTTTAALVRQGGNERPVYVAAPTLFNQPAQPEAPLLMQAEIVGPRLRQAYAVVGLYDAGRSRFTPNFIGAILAEQRLPGGQSLLWQQPQATVQTEWDVRLPQLSDGVVQQTVQMWPTYYPSPRHYMVYGEYRFAESNLTRPAALIINREAAPNAIEAVWVYPGQADVPGLPNEVTPTPGDTFTPHSFAINITTGQFTTSEGQPLTFGQRALVFSLVPAPSGRYVAGFMAQAEDGTFSLNLDGLFVDNPEISQLAGYRPFVDPALGIALLRPEGWQLSIRGDGSPVFTLPGTSLQVLPQFITVPSASDAADANLLARDFAVLRIGADAQFTQVNFVPTGRPIGLPALNAQVFSFTGRQPGQTILGELLLISPQTGQSYALSITGTAADMANQRDAITVMLESFDVLLPVQPVDYFYLPIAGRETVLFADDMLTAESGLPIGEGEFGFQLYDDVFSQYLIQLNPMAGPQLAVYEGTPPLPDDFSLQVEVSFENTRDLAVGVIFRAGNDGSFYTLRISGDGFFTIERADRRSLTPLLDWTPLPPEIEMSEAGGLRLQVEGQGTTYQFFANDIPLAVLRNLVLQGMGYGLIAQNFDRQTNARFLFYNLEMGTLALLPPVDITPPEFELEDLPEETVPEP